MSFDPLTFGFEVVNFLVLGWVLHRLFYRPLRAGIERRREEAARLEAEATRAREVVTEDAEALARERQEVERLRARALEEATERGRAQADRLVEEARKEAAAVEARMRAALDRERALLEEDARTLAIEEATRLAGELLSRWAPEAVDAALLRALTCRIDELQGDAALTSGLKGAKATLEVARPVDEALLAVLRESLARAGGREVAVAVEERPELGAGARLGAGSFVLDASVRGHMEDVRERALVVVSEEVVGA